jgi:hypothetical protein
MMFLEKYRRNNNDHLTNCNAQRFKSAVLKFRYLNGFEGFSEVNKSKNQSCFARENRHG